MVNAIAAAVLLLQRRLLLGRVAGAVAGTFFSLRHVCENFFLEA